MITATRPIATIDELRDHLQYAIGIELTTIPAYLCALYSIEPGSNTAPYEVIQSVVLEEMLHMALAANVLNGIGGVPSSGPVGTGPSPVPVYPTMVPFIDRIPLIQLGSLSPATLDEFIDIERPDSSQPGPGQQYGSIGSFYGAIERGLRELCTDEVFERARSSRAGCQLSSTNYYGGAGALIQVADLDSALEALSAIVREGEGVPITILEQTAAEHVHEGASGSTPLGDPLSVDDLDRLPYGWRMYSHYARFLQIRAERYFEPDQHIGEQPTGDVLPIDWRAVRSMTPNPKAAKYAGTWAFEPMMTCNEVYTGLINMVYDSFNGNPQAARDAVTVMYDLKYHASSLLNMPSPLEPGMRLGPAFEYLGIGHL